MNMRAKEDDQEQRLFYIALNISHGANRLPLNKENKIL